MADQKHLTKSQRTEIEIGLKERKSFKSIANSLGKDNTTIAKEVKSKRIFKQTGACGHVFNNCIHRFGCPVTHVCPECSRKPGFKCVNCGLCSTHCEEYQREQCPKLSVAPYVCNGCDKKNRCTLEKAFYDAQSAQNEYEYILKDSRVGRNFSAGELASIDNVVSPLIRQGQSIHHIMIHHSDEVMCSEKTIYSLVNDGLISAKNIDMPRKVRMKPRSGKKKEFKVDKKCRIGRNIQDYRNYIAEHPDMPVCEMDSVEGVKGGAVLLTLHVVPAKLQMSFIREANTAKSVNDIFNELYNKLGKEDYCKIFPLILGDNGSEFSDPVSIETKGDGERVSRVFYCDPSCPGQKGHCENNHTMIRRVISKGVDFSQFSQDDIDLMMNHINSYARADLGNKSPYDMFVFLYGEEILKKLGYKKIPHDEITLKPSLLKNRNPS